MPFSIKKIIDACPEGFPISLILKVQKTCWINSLDFNAICIDEFKLMDDKWYYNIIFITISLKKEIKGTGGGEMTYKIIKINYAVPANRCLLLYFLL